MVPHILHPSAPWCRPAVALWLKFCVARTTVLPRPRPRAAAAPARHPGQVVSINGGYPQMDALVENLFIKAWFRGTPILGNLHVFRWKMFMLVAFFRIKLLVQFKPWQEYRDPAVYIASSQPLSAMLKKKICGKVIRQTIILLRAYLHGEK